MVTQVYSHHRGTWCPQGSWDAVFGLENTPTLLMVFMAYAPTLRPMAEGRHSYVLTCEHCGVCWFHFGNFFKQLLTQSIASTAARHTSTKQTGLDQDDEPLILRSEQQPHQRAVWLRKDVNKPHSYHIDQPLITEFCTELYKMYKTVCNYSGREIII